MFILRRKVKKSVALGCAVVMAFSGVNIRNGGSHSLEIKAEEVSVTLQDTTSKPLYCDLKYDANGGLYCPQSQQVLCGTEVEIYNDRPMIKHGYTFKGWNTKLDGTGTMYEPGDTFTVMETMTLYAIWESDNEKISLTLEGNGGKFKSELGSGATVLEKDSKTYEGDLGEKVNLSQFGIPVKEGYTFVGWGIGMADPINVLSPTQDYELIVDMTLYAQWEPVSTPTPEVSFTLTLSGMGGKFEGGYITARYNTSGTFTITKDMFPIRDGFELTGWLATNGTIVIRNSDGSYLVQLKEDTYLTALWKANSTTTPTVTETPTSTPVVTQKPTVTPNISSKPDITENPFQNVTPIPTNIPIATQGPMDTPVVINTPEVPSMPAISATPVVSGTPVVIETPFPIVEVSSMPATSATPVVSGTPVVIETPLPTAEVPGMPVTERPTQEPTTVPTIKVTKKPKSTPAPVSLKKKIIRIGKGEKVSIPLNNKEGKKIKYITQNKKIATISSKGIIKGLKVGETNVYATVSGKKYKLTVKVRKKPVTIKISSVSKVKMSKGGKLILQPVMNSGAASYNLKWYSSNKKVVTVNSLGVATIKRKGKAVIKVKTYNGVTGILKLNIK